MSLKKELELLITNRCDEAICKSQEYYDLELKMANTADLEEYKTLVAEQQSVLIKLCYMTGFKDRDTLGQLFKNYDDTQK